MKRIKYVAEIDELWKEAIQTNILSWYRNEGRDLPWRHTRNPYAIVVSEILLHQTTVKSVLPVFAAFMQAFPTVDALAQAQLPQVKAITDPLGYKVRGQWLHTIANIVVRDFDGRIPQSLPELLSLPGIGRYTAGAILSFAFEEDAPILDTNVNRFLGRIFGIEYKNTSAPLKHKLWALAEAIIPQGRASEFNQALIEMGAMVCTSRNPLCLFCPVSAQCPKGISSNVTHAAEMRVTYRPR